jgi:hypothetical protein
MVLMVVVVVGGEGIDEIDCEDDRGGVGGCWWQRGLSYAVIDSLLRNKN